MPYGSVSGDHPLPDESGERAGAEPSWRSTDTRPASTEPRAGVTGGQRCRTCALTSPVINDHEEMRARMAEKEPKSPVRQPRQNPGPGRTPRPTPSPKGPTKLPPGPPNPPKEK